MTGKERRLQVFLKNWRYTLERIAQLENEIKEMDISITPNNDLSGITARGGNVSKIENFYERKEKKEIELQRKKGTVNTINDILAGDKLTDFEKGLIRCLMYEKSMKRYAHKKKPELYVSHIYKIKDNAIRKMASLMKNNTF